MKEISLVKNKIGFRRPAKQYGWKDPKDLDIISIFTEIYESTRRIEFQEEIEIDQKEVWMEEL